MKIDQTNNDILINCNPGARITEIVTIKFIAPSNLLTPARCNLKIAKSTAIEG